MSTTTTRGAVPARKRRATAERSKAASMSKPRKHFSRSQEDHGYVVARVKLSKWFWDQIDQEGRICGFGRRAEFLNALVRRAAGTLRIERHEALPKATYAKLQELGPDEVYAWNVPVEVKALLDSMLEPLGDLPLKAWIVLSILEWLGLAELPDARTKTAT